MMPKKPPRPAEDLVIDADASRLSDNIPNEVKIAIANSIVSYSAMESIAERLIWEITNLSPDDGKLLTRAGTSSNFDTLRKLVEQHGIIVFHHRQTTLEMWKAIKQLVETRNLIVHGVWAMLDNSTPIAISHRISGSDIGHVLGEPFDIGRLQAVERQCYKVKKTFERLSARLVEAAPPPISNPKAR